MSGLADGTRLRISGNPTAEEVTAVVLALDAATAADAAADVAPRRPAWQTAARWEALGGRPVSSAADLRTR